MFTAKENRKQEKAGGQTRSSKVKVAVPAEAGHCECPLVPWHLVLIVGQVTDPGKSPPWAAPLSGP